MSENDAQIVESNEQELNTLAVVHQDGSTSEFPLRKVDTPPLQAAVTSAKVTISSGKYEQLTRDACMLQCLHNQGVDNWDGWSDACEEYLSIYPGDDYEEEE